MKGDADLLILHISISGSTAEKFHSTAMKEKLHFK